MESLKVLALMVLLMKKELFHKGYGVAEMSNLALELVHEYNMSEWEGKENETLENSMSKFVDDLIKVSDVECHGFTLVTSREKDNLVDEDIVFYCETQWLGDLKQTYVKY